MQIAEFQDVIQLIILFLCLSINGESSYFRNLRMNHITKLTTNMQTSKKLGNKAIREFRLNWVKIFECQC